MKSFGRLAGFISLAFSLVAAAPSESNAFDGAGAIYSEYQFIE